MNMNLNDDVTVALDKPQHITVVSKQEMVSFYVDAICFDTSNKKIMFLVKNIPYYTADYHLIKEIIMNDCTFDEFMEFVNEIEDPVFV